jgi:uncharacterized delta-60 repeat protein
MFENLEKRVLLTLVPDANGVISMSASTGADSWEFTQLDVGGVLVWRDLNSGATDQTAAGFTGQLKVDMRGGHDFLRLRTRYDTRYINVPTTLQGGGGNDTLIGGENSDVIYGDDSLNTATGDDKLDGRGFRDTLIGGLGLDTADYSYRNDPLKITLDDIRNDGGVYGELDQVQTDAVLGGNSNDALFGNGAANLLDGGLGNDTIAGGAGNDTLTGGGGIDSIFGEDGNDFVFAREALLDTINDGTGTDSASVDSTAIGDPVSDVGTSAAAPLPGAVTPTASVVAGLSFASSAAFSTFASLSFSSFPSGTISADPSFGGGLVTAPLNGSFARISDVQFQPVEVSPGVIIRKIVVVGSTVGPTGNYDFFVTRYNPDGTLDATFGGGDGVASADFGKNDHATALTVDSLGRLIVVGGSNGEYAIARFTASGALDGSFSGDGKDTWDVGGSSSDDIATGVAVQIVGGQTTYIVAGTAGLNQSNADFLVTRWKASGGRDNGFGRRRPTFSPGSTRDFATGVVVDGAGNIWVCGYSDAGAGFDFALAGLNINGADIAGANQTIDLGNSDQALGMTLNNGQLILVGSSSVDGFSSGAIATFDISGGSATAVAQSIVDGNGQSMVLRDVQVDALGRAATVGAIGGDFAAFWFDPATLETTVGGAVTDFGAVDGAYAAAIDSENRVIAAGLTGDDLAMARYKPDKPIAEILLSFEDVQNASFTYEEDGQTFPLPQDLTQRLRFALGLDGTLTLNGSAAEDSFAVSVNSGIMTVVINGSVQTFPAASVTRIVISGEGGADEILADSTITVPCDFSGGDGDDTITGGSANDTLSGGNGNDSISGGAGNDSIDAGEGDNTVIGDDGNDSVTSGSGNDTVSGGGGSDSIIAGDGANTLDGGADNDAITSGSGNDAVSGGAGNDNINAGGGTNTIGGGVGDDAISSGAGDDAISGDDGNDVINAGDGNNTISGGIGNDNITTGAGTDSVTGGDGADAISSGAGADLVSGGSGDDSVNAGAGNDVVWGNEGNDNISAGDVMDSVSGDAGNDVLAGDADADILLGQAGNDTITGSFGRDILIGGAGSDNIDGGADDDVIISGYTSFDDDGDYAALTLIQAEWLSTGDYTNRIANLNGGGPGGGLNKTTYLRPGNSPNKTVFDDGVKDTLTGGTGLDYFLLQTKGAGSDNLTDRAPGENITQN